MTEREMQYVLSLKDEATAVWKKFSGGVSKETGDLRSMFGQLGTAIGAAFSIGAAKSFMDSAAEASEIADGLTQNLKNQGITSDAVRDSMLEYSEVLKNKTRIDDDEITKIQDTMFAMTGNLDAVKKLTPAVLDLARGQHISTEAAAKMFSKSVEGAEGLKKLGITIGATGSETERLQKIYDAINAKYGGRAETWAQTEKGKIEGMRLSMDDAGKAIGRILNTALMPLVPIITKIFDGFSSLPGPIQTATVVVGVLTASVWALNASLLANPLTWAVLAAAGLVTAFIAATHAVGEMAEKTGAAGLHQANFNRQMDEGRISAQQMGVKLLSTEESYRRLSASLMMVSPHAIEAKRHMDALMMVSPHNTPMESTSDRLKRLKEELSALSEGTNEYNEKLKIILDTEDRVSMATLRAKAAIGGKEEQLQLLNAELKRLDPGSSAWANKMRQILTIENQIELAMEKVKNSIKGVSGVTLDDTFFTTQFGKKLGMLESDVQNTVGNIGKEFKLLSFAPPDGDASVNAYRKQISAISSAIIKMGSEIPPLSLMNFSTGDNDAALKAVQDQAEIYADVRLKAFTDEKDREMVIVDDWEVKALAMAGGNLDLRNEITRVSAQRRAEIEIQSAQKTFESIAGFAQQGVSIISKFTQQRYQADIQALEKRRDKEIKAIDTERQAAKDKYDALMENEALTGEQKSALKKQAEEEDKKILSRKAAIEEEYNNKIRAEKTAAFEAEKRANMLEAIINTAVSVTKVLATPWMIPIVAGLGAAQVALIASQPTPTFHTGGSGFYDAPASSEAYVKIRGGEKIDVYTPEQTAAQNQSRGNIYLTLNFNSPFTPEQAVRSAINELSRQTGLPVDQLFTNQNSSIVVL